MVTAVDFTKIISHKEYTGLLQRIRSGAVHLAGDARNYIAQRWDTPENKEQMERNELGSAVREGRQVLRGGTKQPVDRGNLLSTYTDLLKRTRAGDIRAAFEARRLAVTNPEHLRLGALVDVLKEEQPVSNPQDLANAQEHVNLQIALHSGRI